jgi:Domain of unknown function (DUF4149)
MLDSSRWQALLAGIWAGVLWSIGGLVAPSLFAVLERAQAGAVAGRMFTTEAWFSLLLGLMLLVLQLFGMRQTVGGHARMNLGLLMLALLMTLVGHFLLHPFIQAAKAGQFTALSFAQMHALSTGMFAIKALAVLALAWRLTGQRS